MRKEDYTLQELADLTGSIISGDPCYKISNVADLETATASDASFLSNPRYEQAMQRSKAGVVFIDFKTQLSDGRYYLIHENPSLAFQKLVELLYDLHKPRTSFQGIHPTAVIHDSVKLGENVSIGPKAVIDQEVFIGDNTYISAGCYIGARTTIGNDCYLHPNVTIREECFLGNRIIIQPGAVIGACGFGYITDKTGKHIKLNQLGNVTIEDDVEIGANTTIDRSRFKTTRIGKGTKIDNLVQIAHGVEIGEYNIIVAQAGIAGSSQTGKYVVCAGQTAIAGHLKVGDHITLSARTGVSKSITEAGKYGGTPAIPLNEHNRNKVIQRNLKSYVDEIKNLKERLANLEQTKLN